MTCDPYCVLCEGLREDGVGGLGGEKGRGFIQVQHETTYVFSRHLRQLGGNDGLHVYQPSKVLFVPVIRNDLEV